MVMHLMSSKKEACDFNELVGEAVPDVLLTDQPVTTAPIMGALRRRMLTEQDKKNISHTRPSLMHSRLSRQQPVHDVHAGRMR